MSKGTFRLITLFERKVNALDKMLSTFETDPDPEIRKMLKQMIHYKYRLGVVPLNPDKDLVEFMEGLAANEIPVDNGFTKYIIEQAMPKSANG